MRRIGQLRLLAAGARGAIQPGADVDECGLDGKERVVERRRNRVERGGRLIASLDFGLGFLGRLNLLDRSDPIIGAEYRYLSGVQPDVAKHSGTRVAWIRDG